MKRSRSVCPLIPLALPFVALATPAAFAGPMFLDSVGQPGDDYIFGSGTMLEARFRADTTNWDLRLEDSGNPSAGDNQLDLSNGRGAFEGREFSFLLSYSAATDRLLWSVTRDNGLFGSLEFDTSGLSSFNTIQFASSGSRSEVDVYDLTFTGLGFSEADWPSLSTGPYGPTFAQTSLFLGDDANLLAGDWQLSGSVAFDGFTRDNPSEGAKINARLVQVAQIPGPGSIAGLMLATGFCVVRRRRL